MDKVKRCAICKKRPGSKRWRPVDGSETRICSQCEDSKTMALKQRLLLSAMDAETDPSDQTILSGG